MFTFTTYEKSDFLGLHNSDDKTLVENKEDNKIEMEAEAYLVSYIHGEAETIMGYNIPVYLNGVIKDILEQPCKMLTADKTYDCILIQWDTNKTRYIADRKEKRYYGLLCLKDDIRSIEYARKCASENRNYL